MVFESKTIIIQTINNPYSYSYYVSLVLIRPKSMLILKTYEFIHFMHKFKTIQPGSSFFLKFNYKIVFKQAFYALIDATNMTCNLSDRLDRLTLSTFRNKHLRHAKRQITSTERRMNLLIKTIMQFIVNLKSTIII